MNTQKTSKTLNILLWITQLLLAIIFIMGGGGVILQPIATLAPKMSFVNYYPEAVVRFIGIAEVLGAIGLILPSLLRIKPKLTSLAALGLAVVMMLAAIYHLTHGEADAIFVPIIFGAIAVFIAWGRFKKAPIREGNSVTMNQQSIL